MAHDGLPTRQAGIVALDLSDSRPENAVIYVSRDWDELEQLLVNPLAFMANREYDFKQPPGEEYDWELVSPVTLKITPLGSPTDPALQDAFPDGGYIAEFSIKTHALNIRYLPNPAKAAKLAPRFNGPFILPTLAMYGDLPVGMLHYDTGGNPKDRARFIMDYLENRNRLFAQIKGSGDLLYGQCNLASERQAIQRCIPGSAPLDLAFGVSPSAPLPSMTFEGLSISLPPGCYVCIVSDVKLVDSTYQVGDAIGKIYCLPY